MSLPTPCVGGTVLCGNGIIGPGQPSPTAGPTGTGPTGTGSVPAPNPAAPGAATDGGTASLPAGGAAAAAPLLAPPGVGLVPLPGSQSAASTSPNPDALAVLLSLSIRDGLFNSSFSVWPWLAGIQVALLIVLLAGLCSRQLSAASAPPES